MVAPDAQECGRNKHAVLNFNQQASSNIGLSDMSPPIISIFVQPSGHESVHPK